MFLSVLRAQFDNRQVFGFSKAVGGGLIWLFLIGAHVQHIEAPVNAERASALRDDVEVPDD